MILKAKISIKSKTYNNRNNYDKNAWRNKWVLS